MMIFFCIKAHSLQFAILCWEAALWLHALGLAEATLQIQEYISLCIIQG
jgi:hypothetical protein